MCNKNTLLLLLSIYKNTVLCCEKKTWHAQKNRTKYDTQLSPTRINLPKVFYKIKCLCVCANLPPCASAAAGRPAPPQPASRRPPPVDSNPSVGLFIFWGLVSLRLFGSVFFGGRVEVVLRLFRLFRLFRFNVLGCFVVQLSFYFIFLGCLGN